MRERLTAAFVILSVLLLLGAGIVRSLVLRDLIREQEAQHLHEDAAYISQIVTDRQAAGDRVNRAFLKTLVDPNSRLVYAPDAGKTLVVTGRDYDGGDTTDDLSASRQVSGGQVTVSQSPAVVRDIIGRDFGSVLVLFLMIAVVAGLIGYYVSTALSAPFRQLAAAAAALGRGRFDLDLPKTRIPEAQAIAQALRTSAGQLEDRLRRERDFAEHASHVLRTPLTGLRFELEDLAQRDDVPEDARVAATRGMKSVDDMNRVTGDLVQLARSGTLVAGAELPLVDLATQLAQRWADRLAVRGRSLTASAEGDLTLTYTPGPVEHVLDLVLADVVRRGTGAVRIVFCGQEGGLLRVKVASEGAASERYAGLEPADRLEEARAVAAALGGRISGDDPGAGVEVLLPRR